MKHTIISLILALAFALPAFAAENTCHNMAGGTFGVAWLDSTGEIRLFDGQKSVRLMGFYEKGHQIAAFDNDGTGKTVWQLSVWTKNRSIFSTLKRRLKPAKRLFCPDQTETTSKRFLLA